MSRSTLSVLTCALISGCTSKPKCPEPLTAHAVYSAPDSCEVRIRSVIIGSDLKLPESLKHSDLARFELNWIESKYEAGHVTFGHFVLAPPKSSIDGSAR